MPHPSENGQEFLPSWLSVALEPGLGDAVVSVLVSGLAVSGHSPFEASDAELAGLGLGPAPIRRLRDCGARFSRSGPPEPVRRILDWAALPENTLLLRGCGHYPRLLAEAPGSPPLLYLSGRPMPRQAPALAIVGARRGTAAGRETAGVLATDLAGLGATVVSGLALGIDAAAHAASLDAGGFTVAVLGCGTDVVYPRANAGLQRRIVERGCLVSEFPPGTAPRRQHFPRRNRIISGLALGVVVVEAGLRSGSLVTARHALEQGREVFAVPGSVHNPLSRGCHRLLREGATLVEGIGDIVNGLPDWSFSASAGGVGGRQRRAIPVPGRLSRVHDALEHAPVEIDRVVARSGLPAAEVMAALVELELLGHARNEAGGYARRDPLAS